MIVINTIPADLSLLQEWFRGLTGRKTRLYMPQRGEKKALLDMVMENARLLREEKQHAEAHYQKALQQLSRDLELDFIPQRIEGYDVSHLSGEETVASMVVFTAGKPDKKSYRRFKIKLAQNDDYASLAEALRRRFAEAREGNPSFLPEPDLLLIDGGLGQLNTAKEVLRELEIEIPVIALAKREEVIFRQDGSPLKLSSRNHAYAPAAPAG